MKNNNNPWNVKRWKKSNRKILSQKGGRPLENFPTKRKCIQIDAYRRKVSEKRKVFPFDCFPLDNLSRSRI